ncbi:MAG: hypothetical protein AAF721_04405 [Myxococcota bacterium]
MTEAVVVVRRLFAAALLAYCAHVSVVLAFRVGGFAGPMVLIIGWCPIGLGWAVLSLLDHSKEPRKRPKYGVVSTLGRMASLSLIAVHGLVAMLALLPIVGLSAFRGRSDVNAALRRSVAAFAGFVAAVICIGLADPNRSSLSPLDYALAGHAVLWLWLGFCERREFLVLRRDSRNKTADVAETA